jgi:hypothetical protein
MSAGPQPLFRSRLLAGLIALAGISALATVLLLAFGEHLAEPPSAGADSFSYSAIGHHGVYTFLRAAGVVCVRSRDPLLPSASKGSVVLAAEPRDPAEDRGNADALRALIVAARRRGAGTIVVLPKWIGSPSPVEEGFVDGVSLHALTAVTAVLSAAVGTSGDAKTSGVRRLAPGIDGKATTSWGETYDVRLRNAQVLVRDDTSWTPLLWTESGLLAAMRKSPHSEPLVVVADPDLLNNHGLHEAEHAPLVLDLLTKGLKARAVVLDETLHGFSRRSRLLADALSIPWLFVTVHVSLVLALAAWAGAVRFGHPRPERPDRSFGRREFVASTARLLLGTRDEAASLVTYWRLAQDSVAQAWRVPAIESSPRLRRLAAISSARGVGEDPLALEREVTEAAFDREQPERWVALAQRIERWQREMTRGPRITP